MIKKYWYGQVNNNQLMLNDPQGFREYLMTLNGVEVKASIEKKFKKRTSKQDYEKSNQNGYYWGVVIPILCENLGYTEDEMHEAIKFKFLRIGGTDELPRVKSTTKLSTEEWETLMQKIRDWAMSELNIYIPEPNEAGWR